MSLASGTRIGPYEIGSPIGAGGMGEVYRARDTKLGREVAIKVLPEELAADAERVARFEREAKLLASLNHPNIASIYGLESFALVLELVEGPTLAERIQQSAIPIDETIAIAKQIADALEAGHEAGVIHRDLKPANVKLKDDGTVKVLDYGLAKAFEGDAAAGASAELSQSPTLTRQGTQIGVILGTAAYMSPEQAKGKRVDKRTDVFAFGSVLFEMLTGKKAFPGNDVSEVLASVIQLEPDWSALPPSVSQRLTELLRRCLEKDPRKRWRDIGDVRNELERIETQPDRGVGSISPRRREWLTSIAGVVGLLVGLGLARLLFEPDTEPLVTRMSVIPVTRLSATLNHAVTISPDGRSIAYTAGELYVRDLSNDNANVMPGTRGATGPAFSPDGRWLAFWSTGGLKKVALTGGSPSALCTVTNPIGGLSWATDGFLYFADLEQRIRRVPESGGEPETLIQADGSERVGYPYVLPDGRTLLYSQKPSPETDTRVMAYSLETGERRLLIEGASDARYASSGHLIFTSGGSLHAVPFDAERLEVDLDRAIPLPELVEPTLYQRLEATQFVLSETGTLVYVSTAEAPEELHWANRRGLREPLGASPVEALRAQLSPDGSRIALERGGDMWVYDIGRGAMSRLTSSGGNLQPIWTPDGNRVLFSGGRDGNIYWTPADGSGAPEPVTSAGPGVVFHTDDVSPDGTLVYHQHDFVSGQTDLWLLDLMGDHEARLFLRNASSGPSAAVSPDGKWLSYVSSESGKYEVFVTPFPDGGARFPVSTGGGAASDWSPDGSELYYFNEGRLMVVDVVGGKPLKLSAPRPLFDMNVVRVASDSIFDVSPDGDRFLLVEAKSEGITELRVVLNWHEELKRLVPVE